MAESRVVIKINYDKEQQFNTAPKNVTVWHYGRISVALAVLLIPIIIMLLFWPTGSEVEQVIKSSPIAQIDSLQSGEAKSTAINSRSDITNTKTDEVQQKAIQRTNTKIEPYNQKLRSTTAIILDKKVIRASLNTSIKDNEPYQQVKDAINLAKQDSIQLFYFNQLKNIRDKTLFHCWRKDGKLVLKKALLIKSGSTKVFSEKTMTSKDNGDWQIQLLDAKGKVYSEVNFVIETE
jgi:hypothetical protein